jgi:hypothetical protein
MNLQFRSPAVLLLVIAISASQGVISQEPAKDPSPALAPAPGRMVQSLTAAPGYFTEPGVAVNPRNPEQVVAVFQDNAHASYSLNGGRDWQAASGVEPPNYRVSGDVSVTYDLQGHAIICYMAFDKLGTFNYWGHNSSRNGLFVRRSLDGGKTWESDHIPIIEHPTKPGVPWEDKPYIVADNGKGPYAGNLYVGWTRWTVTDSEILLSRSTDGGKTWSKPIEIDDHPGLPRDDNGALEGFAAAVAPDSTVYAVWSSGEGIVLTSSHDGGRTFSRPRLIIRTAPIMFAVQTLERANGFPQIAMDPKSSRLYVTWSDYRNGDLDVFCISSSDNGKTWSQPVRVNSDPLHDGADQFFQWSAVDPTDGSINVVFYDRREDPQNRRQTVVLARSSDAGRSFVNYAWTDDPFEAGGVFFGDYTGIAAFGGRVYGVWTEKPPNQAEPAQNSPTTPRRRQGTVVKVGIADFSRPTTTQQ